MPVDEYRGIPFDRRVLSAVGLLAVIPVLVGMFLHVRHAWVGAPPPAVPSATLVGFTGVAAITGSWLLRQATRKTRNI